MSVDITYPLVTTTYAKVDAGALKLYDTTSQFNLDGDADPLLDAHTVIYTLPGFPFNSRTPIDRLLIATASSGGAALIGPPDYALKPQPLLADFGGVLLNSVGDFARVLWTGSLWTIAGYGGPSVGILTVGQDPP